ncbi:CbtA family protein [Pseudomonas marginalis]|uniref:CbtA family protein n=1 Tax=Pseudomonas TaxID=286 RepID=UPI00389B2AAA
MISRLLLNGILTGILAGVVSFGVLHVFVEPQMERAIAFEQQKEANETPVMAREEHTSDGQRHQAADGAHVHGEVVSRETQAGVGALVATTVFGGAVGGLFALVFCFLHGRVGSTSARMLSFYISIGALLAFVILPTLKYPATPPGVGLSGTIGERTAFYFLLIAGSLLLQGASVVCYQKLKRNVSGSAPLLAIGVYAIMTTIMFGVLPSINEVPSDFSGEILSNFRMASVATQTVLWVVIGLIYGWYAHHALSSSRKRHIPVNG